MGNIRNFQLPRQRLPFSKKTKEWRKDNLDFADRYTFYNDQELRKSIKNKLINLNLYNGKVDVRDITKVVNPYNIDSTFISDNIPHHPIVVPKIDLLLGEESARKFDPSVVVLDSNSITLKNERKKAALKEKLIEILSQNLSQEEAEEQFLQLDKYMKYSWKDLREKMANQILRYYWEKDNMKEMFNECFKDVLLFGEEAVILDGVNGEPIMTKVNPLKIRAIRSGNSDRFEDASLIIFEDYKSPAQIVDEFYEELKPSDIDYIMDYSTTHSKGTYSDDHENHVLMGDNAIEPDMFNSFMEMAEFNGHVFGSDYTDEYGNIRVLKVRWKSLRKIKKIKYYDEFGNEGFRFESEEYKIDKALGEEETVLWINEAWEGTKIGKNIYLKMRPMQTQFTSSYNPSKTHLGVIGQIYSTGQGKAVSPMDRAKNYQYMYDIVWDRLNKAIASNHGKILELDLAKVPANWEIDKWMHFAFVNKIAVVDGFKEGNHGAATGKLAGGMNTIGGRAIDMDNGNYIQQHIQLLEFIKMELSEVIGVSKQREGQISNRETVGAVERSVNQSSHITEYLFSKHESFKIRALTAFLELAKQVLREKGNLAIQNVLDDVTSEVLLLDIEEFSAPEAEYGIVITNSRKYAELEAMLKESAQAMVQSGGRMSTLMDILFSPSMQEMRKKIENVEDEKAQQEQAQLKEQREQFAQAQAQAKELADRKDELEKYKIDTEDATKRYLGELAHSKVTDGGEPVNDDIAERKMDLEERESRENLLIKIRELDDEMKRHDDEIKLRRSENKVNKNKK